MKILLASRSWSNESEGRDMHSCLVQDGIVLAYFPTANAMMVMADKLHIPVPEKKKASGLTITNITFKEVSL